MICSTPISKSTQITKNKEIVSGSNETIVSIIRRKDIDGAHNQSNNSKTSLLLIDLFGNSDEVNNFDNIRKKIKETVKQRKNVARGDDEEYKALTSNFKIKLNCLKVNLHKKIRTMELSTLKDRNSLSLQPDEKDLKLYQHCQCKLKYIAVLLDEFS